MKEIIIDKNANDKRLDKFLTKLLCQSTKSFVYKMLRKKNIVLNDKKATGNEILKTGDVIKIYFSDETYDKLTTPVKEITFPDIPREFSVIYEDEDVIVINKWANVLSQKAKDSDISINEYMLSYLYKNGKISDESLKTFKPSVLNRLDRNTTGIIIGGCSLKGSQVLSKALKHRTIGKYYLAIVKGRVDKNISLKSYLYKDEETNKVYVSDKPDIYKMSLYKPIETEYEVIKSGDSISLIKVHLITGKTHQIRAHLSYIGHPLVGDVKYGDSKTNGYYKESYGVKRQMLHAYELDIPENFELENLKGNKFTIDIPDDMKRVYDSIS